MDILGTTQLVTTILATISGGIIVTLGNLWLNKKGVDLNVQEAANSAATAVVNDMRKLIEELRAELKRKDDIILQLRTEVESLRKEIKKLTEDLQHDTARIIRNVKKR